MSPALIFALLAVATFIAGGIAGGRSTFAEKLAAAYLKESDNPWDVEQRHDFLIRARKAEATAWRWDTFGILTIMFTVLFVVLAIVNLLTGL